MTKDELLKTRIQSAKWEIKVCDAKIKEELDYMEKANDVIVELSKKTNKKQKLCMWNTSIKNTLEIVDDLNNQHTSLTKKLTLLTEQLANGE